jgi:hypothetical protein
MRANGANRHDSTETSKLAYPLKTPSAARTFYKVVQNLFGDIYNFLSKKRYV